MTSWMPFLLKWGGKMNVLNLSWANIKKRKGAAFSLFILILTASLLLNIGITIVSSMGRFYEKKADELHDAHAVITMSASHFKPSTEDYIKAYEGVKEQETERIILIPKAAFRYDKSTDNDFSLRIALLNADNNRNIAPLKLVESLPAKDEAGIYAPYSLKSSGGYHLGDSFSFTYQNVTYSYKITGFFESTLMGKPNLAMMKFYLPDTTYRELQHKLGAEAEGILQSAVFKDSRQSASFLSDYSTEFPQLNDSNDINYWSGDIGQAESSTLTINIVAMILIVFAAIIVVVSLIVIKFRIADSIEEGMVNIGVLKALGYTSRQISSSFALQFTLTGLAGSLAGVALSYAAVQAFGGIIATLTGLRWPGGTPLGNSLLSIAILMVLVWAVAMGSAWRIRRLQPVAALRGGILTHNFKRNHLPLHKAKGGLQFLLACKTMLANSRQNLLIGCIITAITFASVFSAVFYYNIAEDKTAFFQMTGAETPNVGIQVQQGQDSERLLKEIKAMNGVEKAVFQDYLTVTINGRQVSSDFSDDYEQMDNNTVVKGRHPKYDNEIVITSTLSRLLGKSIGDTINVDLGKVSEPFLITGLSQSLSTDASLALEGVQRLMPGQQAMSINVYLDGTTSPEFIEAVKSQYPDRLQSVTNAEKSIEDSMKVYISAIFTLMVVILAITVLTVSLILYLVIQTGILKRKRELGIMRALGYTTFQLRSQIAMSFLPVVTVGVLVGTCLGGLYTNSLLEMLLSSAGIAQVNFKIQAPMIIGLGIGLVLFSYLISMLVSRRIKRITAYELITE